MKLNILVCVLLFLSSCANNYNVSVKHEKPDTGIVLRNLQMSLECFNVWSTYFDEWRLNGGMLFNSIEETREYIKLDNKTLLSKVIRDWWVYQDKLGIYEKREDFARSDISDDDYRKVTFPYKEVFEGVEPEKCKSFLDLDDVIWNELNNSQNKSVHIFDEVGNGKWDSPYAQQWTLYWLLVNIK